MSSETKIWLKALSPRLIAKGLVLLDKSTSLVVGVCWSAAAITMILAVVAVHSAVSARKEADLAAIAEPVLPVAATSAISGREVQSIIDRLQHQFPDIKFESQPNVGILIKSTDGTKFHQWITALSYVDTMAPQFRWSLVDFCVGACANQDLMRATISGQKVVFSLPPPQH